MSGTHKQTTLLLACRAARRTKADRCVDIRKVWIISLDWCLRSQWQYFRRSCCKESR